jgi:hypothetical protein
MQSLIIIHPFQLLARWNLSRPNIITCKQLLYSKAEYSNTQQDLTVPKIIFLDMQGFWLVGLFFQKATKIIDSYFRCFSSSSSELIFTKWAIYYKHK